MTPLDDRWCAGFGIAGHLADGALIEILQPVRMKVCRPCWRRWLEARQQPDWSTR